MIGVQEIRKKFKHIHSARFGSTITSYHSISLLSSLGLDTKMQRASVG